MYKEVHGNLILKALIGEFDVIAHGCNCFCTMGSGIAVIMNEHFGCSEYPLEDRRLRGDINKLGQIDWKVIPITNLFEANPLYVVNAYTQYGWNRFQESFDYEAFILCMRKINHVFGGKHIGLPRIGAGLAGGDWEIIKEIIIKELCSCDVTVVIYNK